MNKIKKIFFAITSLFLVAGGATACKEKVNPQELVDDVYASLIYPNLTNGIKANFELYNEIDGVKISYVSADPTLLEISKNNDLAIVHCPAIGSTEDGKGAITSFTATLKYEDVTKDKQFRVRILEKGAVVSVEEFRNLTSADTGKQYSLDGIVIAINDRSFLLADETAKVALVYKSGTGVAVGDYVEVDGPLAFYSGVPQFDGKAAVAILTETPSFTYTTPTPTTWGPTELDAYLEKTAVDDLSGNYITVTGKLSVSGSYYNLEVAGTSKAVGSLVYPLESSGLDAYNGKVIKVTGYTLYVTGSRYVNIFFTDFEEVNLTDAEKLDLAVNAISVPSDVTADFVLPKTSSYNSTVTWTSDNSVITIGTATADGYPATVAKVDKDTAVKLTATVSLGSETPKTKDFTVNVLSVIEANVTVAQLREKAIADEDVSDAGLIAHGVVAAKGNSGSNLPFYLVDDSGTILVYTNDKNEGVNTGDEVYIKITALDVFNNTPQIKSYDLLKTASTGKSHGLTATQEDIATLTAHAKDTEWLSNPANINELSGKYIEITGYVLKSGNYLNLYAENNTSSGQVQLMYTNAINDYENEKVTVRVFVYGYSKLDGSGYFRASFDSLVSHETVA